MHVRRIAPQDSTKVARLFESVLASLTYYNDRAKREEQVKYTADELQKLAAGDPDSVLIAEIDDELAGFCISRYDDGLLWLSWFAVAEAHRRKGVGRALLSTLERTAPGRNCHKIWCDTRVPNERSAQLLQTAGFRQLCKLTNHWYQQDFFLWAKELAA